MNGDRIETKVDTVNRALRERDPILPLITLSAH